MGSGNKLQRQKNGPLEGRREKVKVTSRGPEEGDGKGTGVLPEGERAGYDNCGWLY